MVFSFSTSPRARLYRVSGRFAWVILQILWVRYTEWIFSSERNRERWERTHLRCAESVTATILKFKGLLIKVGQFMSLRVDLLPRPYTRTLSRLQDQVPPLPFAQIQTRIEEELERPLSEIFERIETTPIASASLGQVHEARLQSGERVAVKVQYPGIDRIVETDVRILRLIFRWLSYFRRDFQVDQLIREIRRFVHDELDYLQEARSAERIAGAFASDPAFLVPKVHWGLTTERVLVLEFIQGIKVSNLEALEAAGISRNEVCRKVMDIYFRMLFKTGFFQADAHPGNLFALPAEISEDLPPPDEGKPFRLLMVDFGLAKEVPPGLLKGFGKLSYAFWKGEAPLMAEALVEMGFQSADGHPEAFRAFADIAVRHGKSFLYRRGRNIDFAGIAQEITDTVRSHPVVRIPSDFLLIARVLGQLSGLGKVLKARLRLDEVVLPYVLEAFGSPPVVEEEAGSSPPRHP